MTEFIEIDGSVLEGGGQILRISISLSAILGIPIRVSKIRSNRRKPGLAPQHLTGIQLVGQMCQAQLRGVHISSTEIEFIPQKIKGGHYYADTKTAGSISLMLQVALPCALLADGPVTLDLRGGTNAEMAPQIDYMINIFKPLLNKFNADFNLQIHRRGYYPKGGGHVTVEVDPVSSLGRLSLTERGNIVAIRGVSFVAGVLPLGLAEAMREGAMKGLDAFREYVDIQKYKEDRKMAPNNCSGIVVWSQLSGGGVVGSDGLGKRGLDPRRVGLDAGTALRDLLQANTCVDSHGQDQIIIYMALAEGKSSVRTAEITLHIKTAIHITEVLTKVKFDVREDAGSFIIECTGLGIVNRL